MIITYVYRVYFYVHLPFTDNLFFFVWFGGGRGVKGLSSSQHRVAIKYMFTCYSTVFYCRMFSSKVSMSVRLNVHFQSKLL